MRTSQTQSLFRCLACECACLKRMHVCVLVYFTGLTKVPIDGQPASIVQELEEMAKQYIKGENAIILAVTPANADLATSDALRISREVDPQGDRTIGKAQMHARCRVSSGDTTELCQLKGTRLLHCQLRFFTRARTLPCSPEVLGLLGCACVLRDVGL